MSAGEYRASVTLTPGQGFSQTLQLRAPTAIGPCWLIVVTDPEGSVAETLEDNNTAVSVLPVQVVAAYHATVATDITTATAGTPIPLSGQARRAGSAEPMPYALVNIHVGLRDTRRLIAALTDETGGYTATFTPLPTEAGHYTLGADHPGAAETAVQDEFFLLGFQAQPASVALTLAESCRATGAVTLVNLGELPLNGLSADVVSQPAGLAAVFSVEGGGGLSGNTRATMRFTIDASPHASPGGTILARVHSAEGAGIDLPIHVTVHPLRAQVMALPGFLSAGMARGHQTTLNLDVINLGGAASEAITVSLPPIPWFQVAGSNPLPPLPPGQTNTVTLLLTPPPDLALGLHSGTIVLSSGTASLALPFEFRALSEARGALRVTAVDEFTYYARGSPGVTQFTVRLADPVTGNVVTNAASGDAAELVLCDLPEAYYDLDVQAQDHGASHTTIFVAAGRTNDAQVFLPRQAVRYTWTVEPTEIEDRTRLVLTTTFESYVPMPVVSVEPASLDLATFTQEVSHVEFKISNHGLVAAEAARFLVEQHPQWVITPLTEALGQIPAQTTLTLPVTLRRVPAASPAGARSAGASASPPVTVDPCNLMASIAYQLICGTYFNTYQSPIALYNAADCGTKIPVPDLSLPGGGGTGPSDYLVLQPTQLAVPVAWQTVNLLSPLTELTSSLQVLSEIAGGSSLQVQYVPPVLPHTLISNLCDPCTFEYVAAGLGCAWDFWGPSLTPEIIDCVLNGASFISEPGTTSFAETVSSCAEYMEVELPVLGQALSLIQCGESLLDACGKKGWNLVGQAAAAPAALGMMPLPDGEPPSSLAWVATQYQRLRAFAEYRRAFFGDDAWFQPGVEGATAAWLAAFDARIQDGSEQAEYLSENERADLLGLPCPAALAPAGVGKFLDRWNRSLDYEAAGVYDVANVPPGQSADFIARDVFTQSAAAVSDAILANAAEGITDPLAGFQMAVAQLNAEVEQGGGGGVCGKVSLQLDQSAVVSRDAFRATLEVANGAGEALTSFAATLRLIAEDGQSADDLFGVQPPELEHLGAVDGSGEVAPGTTARVMWTLIPTTEAAPEQPTIFYVSGVLSYRQGVVAVAIPLASVPITVYPTPRLFVKYFHERDVFSDDPFTEAVEPAVPFNLAVQVENRGCGAARNLRITSGQPRIVENEKGLLVDFRILATQLEGQSLSPSLTLDFGTLTNGQRAVGRWLFTASLQGLFTDYAAAFEHIDGLGNPKLSLIEEVTIHEMTRLVEAGGAFDDGRPDFLVNDVPDPADLPDTLHLSQGAPQPVTAVCEASGSQPPSTSQLVVQLTAPMPAGWGYLRVPDPGSNTFQLIRVVRADGRDLPRDTGFWTTDRTFIGLGKRPVYEPLLHLLDHDSPGAYALHYTVPPMPDTNAPSSAVAPLPADSPTLFDVRWSGDDPDGHAIAAYDIYVSIQGNPFQPWLAGTSLRGATWVGTPGAQYAFYSIATDDAGNRELPPPVPDASTTVTLTNQPPVFDPVEDQTIDEGVTFQRTLTARDPDGAGSLLTYSLGAGAPAGALLHPTEGRLTWFTSESTGPGTNLFVIEARDSGFPALTATSRFTLVVREVNAPPSLAPVASATLDEGEFLTFTNTATDPDIPTNTLRFTLQPGAPRGAAVDEFTGVFRWQPTEIQGPSTNLMGIVVSDNGDPSLSDVREFTVVVRDVLSDFAVRLGSTNVFAGESNAIPLILDSGLELNNLTLLLEWPPDRLTHLALSPVSTEVLASVLRLTGTNQCALEFQLDAPHTQPGSRTLARLDFVSGCIASSAIVPLELAGVTGTRADGVAVTNAFTAGGRIIVVAEEPVLTMSQGAPPLLTLFGKPGTLYAVQWATNLASTLSWAPMASLHLAGPFASIPVSPSSLPCACFRACAVDASHPTLAMKPLTPATVLLLLEGRTGASYTIQTTTNLANPDSWFPALDFLLTNTTQTLHWTNATEPARFFRALDTSE